jgi:hypothetical protein
MYMWKRMFKSQIPSLVQQNKGKIRMHPLEKRLKDILYKYHGDENYNTDKAVRDILIAIDVLKFLPDPDGENIPKPNRRTK